MCVPIRPALVRHWAAEPRLVLTGSCEQRKQATAGAAAGTCRSQMLASTSLYESPICVSSMWSASLSLSPACEQQPSHDTHFLVTLP